MKSKRQMALTFNLRDDYIIYRFSVEKKGFNLVGKTLENRIFGNKKCK